MFKVNIQHQNKLATIELRDENNQFAAEIFSFGGMLNKFECLVENKMINVVEAYENISDAIEQKNTWFKSCKMSPFVCRLQHGEFNFNNQTYKTEKFYLQQHAIHGLIYDCNYNIIRTEATDDMALVELEYFYNATDKGYPFTYSNKIIWCLKKEGVLEVSTTVSHQNNFEIPFCDGWHPYFKMDIPIDECTLIINSKESYVFNDEMIPSGEIFQNKLFRSAETIANKNLDHCFKLNNSSTPNCVLNGNKIKLQISNTNYPFLQVYTPPNRESIAIENLSAIPNAFNNKIGLRLLEANKLYEFVAKYSLATTNS